MFKKQYANFANTPFRLEIERIKNAPGTWESNKVSIFRDNVLIGEYIRNYQSFSALTFYPFLVDGEWYALYSAHYTATRVMKLHPDRIEDWCGEEPTANGFCPVEIYVPKYKKSTNSMTIKGVSADYTSYYVDCDFKDDADFLKETTNEGAPLDIYYCDFGFICGCVWGDDSNWKIQYIDLKQIPNKVLTITEKFGYWVMPRALSLKECIDMTTWEPDEPLITLTRAEYINIETGHRYS